MRSPTTPDRAGRDDLRTVARLEVIGDTVTEILEPDQQHLRLPSPALADAFLGLYSGRKRTVPPQPAQLSAEQLVDLFLHGAMTNTEA